jgi:dsDNA-specific endonuclease/ATPase MutS2
VVVGKKQEQINEQANTHAKDFRVTFNASISNLQESVKVLEDKQQTTADSFAELKQLMLAGQQNTNTQSQEMRELLVFTRLL